MTTDTLSITLGICAISGLLGFSALVAYLCCYQQIRAGVKQAKLTLRNLLWDVKQIFSVVVYLWEKRRR